MTKCDLCGAAGASRSHGDGTLCADCKEDVTGGREEPDPGEAREVFAGRLREAGASAERFIDVLDGEKRPRDHTRHPPGSGALSGNYGVYAGRDGGGKWLVDVDVDDYQADELPEEVGSLPDTFTIESPHTDPDGPGGHRYFVFDGDAAEVVEDASGAKNPAAMGWGEVRVHNQYCVGPGSQLDGCGKDWCDRCSEPDGGYYRIKNDAPIAELSEGQLRRLVSDGEADAGSAGGGAEGPEAADSGDGAGPGNALDDGEVVDRIRGSEQAEKFERLYDEGDTSAYDHDDSRADYALASILAWWTGGDEAQIERIMRDSALARPKWDDHPTYLRERTIRKAVESQDNFFRPGVLDWDTVRWKFRDDDVSAGQARRDAAELLREERKWLTTRDTETLYVYDEGRGVWDDSGEQAVHTALVEELGEHFTRHTMNEVASRLRGRSYVERDELGADLGEPLVAVENGTLDLYSGELLEHDPGHRLLTHVPVEYDPDAECGEFRGFLEMVMDGDSDKVDTVFELLASAIAPGLPVDNFAILHGNGRNGKTTLLRCMEEFVGDRNTVGETLHRLATDNHAMTGLYGARLCVGGDLDSSEIRRTGIIKQLSGGDTVRGNPKGKSPFDFESKAQMVFAANDPPEFDDGSTALYRRLVALEMPVEIPPEEQEPMQDVLDRLASPEELSGMLNEALEAYRRLLTQSRLSAQPESEEANQIRYERQSNPVRRFVEACCMVPEADEKPADYSEPKEKVLSAYQGWAVDVGARQLNKTQLAKKLYDLEAYQVESYRKRGSGRTQCFKGLELDTEGLRHAGATDDLAEHGGTLGV